MRMGECIPICCQRRLSGMALKYLKSKRVVIGSVSRSPQGASDQQDMPCFVWLVRRRKACSLGIGVLGTLPPMG